MICIRYKSLDLRLSPTGYAKGNAYVFCVVKMHYAAKKSFPMGDANRPWKIDGGERRCSLHLLSPPMHFLSSSNDMETYRGTTPDTTAPASCHLHPPTGRRPLMSAASRVSTSVLERSREKSSEATTEVRQSSATSGAPKGASLHLDVVPSPRC
jgi:hypothetical protein